MSNYQPGNMKSYPPEYPDGSQYSSQQLHRNDGVVEPPYGADGGIGTPPPPYPMEKVPGYENATFDSAVSPPPTAPDSTESQPERAAIENLPHLTAEDARDAVIRFASENCCYGSGPAIDMPITDISMNSAFRYTLETFGEKRESAWRFVPYIGQHIDGQSNGPAPTPWDISVRPQENFKNSRCVKEVPHTAFVKPCHVCVGNGRVRCERCRGKGRLNSSSSTVPDRCYSCSGRGQQECGTCRGKGNLKGFVELTVTWTNHRSEYVSETTNVPKELIRSSVGRLVLQEDMPKVVPITGSGSDLINMESQNLITKHSQSFPNERVLRQRQILLIIPVAQCSYKWKDTSGSFCVYGFDHRVHFPDYPEQICCGCNIL